MGFRCQSGSRREPPFHLWHARGLQAAGAVAATTPESDALSRDLKQRGFKFVGSTIIYAHMQAIGLVNDHSLDCFQRRELLELG